MSAKPNEDKLKIRKVLAFSQGNNTVNSIVRIPSHFSGSEASVLKQQNILLLNREF